MAERVRYHSKLYLSEGITEKKLDKIKKKLEKKPLSLGIFICGFFALLAIEIFSLHFSSIALLLIAAVVSLAVFLGKGGVQ